jgi:FlaA1/EpsC-like NDP-sugar epimerase
MLKKILKLIIFILFIPQLQLKGENLQENNFQLLFENKNILITGGTGYLGRTLAEEILNYNPNEVTIISRDEVKLFNIRKFFNFNPKVRYFIGDVRDYQTLFEHTKNIDLVIHTAALKRMDALESNVEEAIKTNILGTVNLFHAAIANNVKKVIYISTDKACSPVNIYGACKFAGEKLFNNYDTKKIKTNFISVRFGNILESTGSVIPLFIEKIKKGDDISLTDPRMTRFIVHKKEAVEFIFNAIKYGVGGEIFIKQLPALKVTDLIEVLKNKFNANNVVKITGLRPGEKIDETLINETEIPRTYAFNGLFVITPSLNEWLDNLKKENMIPLYIQHGNLLNEKIMGTYNSRDAVISKDNLADLFNRINLEFKRHKTHF